MESSTSFIPQWPTEAAEARPEVRSSQPGRRRNAESRSNQRRSGKKCQETTEATPARMPTERSTRSAMARISSGESFSAGIM